VCDCACVRAYVCVRERERDFALLLLDLLVFCTGV